MTTKTRTVRVQTAEQPISYLNQAGEEVTLGVIAASDYQGENLTRYALNRKPEDPDSQSNDVGMSKHEFSSFLNHADAQRPMFDLGFKLSDITIGRGGADIYTLWEYPDGHLPVIEDPINWDIEAWGTDRTTRYAGQPLKPGIIMQGTLRSGRGQVWTSSILRLICTNGLTRWESQGDLYKANGSNFEPATLAEALFRAPTKEVKQDLMGRTVGNRHGVDRAAILISSFFSETVAPEQRELMLQQTPAVLQDTMNALDRAPSWLTNGIVTQLGLFSANSGRDMTELDIQNAVTNAINLPRFGPRDENVESQAHSASRAFRMSNAISTSIKNLVGIYTLAA